MEIDGLQKVSTIDYPGEICCVVFLRGCNFRCGFCHNPGLVIKKSGTGFLEKDVLGFLKKRIGKIDAVCISGGEPLMSLDLDFVRRIKEMGFKIKIDTNGSFPERLKEIIDLGLVDYIAMDLKGCRRDYSRIVNANSGLDSTPLDKSQMGQGHQTGRSVDLSSIEKSMKIIYDFGEEINKPRTSTDEHGFENRYEFRTTVVSRFHDAENLVEMAKWVVGVCGGKPRRFFLQGFRNSGDLVGADFGGERDVKEEELNKFRDLLSGYFEEIEVRV